MAKAKPTSVKRERNLLLAVALFVAVAILFAGLTTGKLTGKVPAGAEYNTAFIAWTLVYAILAVGGYILLKGRDFAIDDNKLSFYMPIVLMVAFIAQCVIGAAFRGYYYDIGTNMAWAIQSGQDLFNIYNSASFIDYPPGMMYIWAPLAWLNNLLGGGNDAMVLLVKIPGIIANMGLAWLAYKWTSDIKGRTYGFFALCIVALNPLLILDTCLWGQTDSVLMLFVMLAVYFMDKDKFPLATVFLALAIMTKPQAIFTFPLLAFELVRRVVVCDADKRWRRIGDIGICVLIGAAVCFGICLPFSIKNGGIKWIFELFLNTAGEYNYASLNACNFWSMLGFNTAGGADTWMLFSFNTWGKIFIGLVTLAVLAYNIMTQSRYRVLISALALNFGYFMFATVMHERYIFPAAIVAMFAALVINHKAVYAFAGAIWATAIANINDMLYLQQVNNWPYPQTSQEQSFVVIVSMLNMLILVALTVFIVKKCMNDVYLDTGATVTRADYGTKQPVVPTTPAEPKASGTPFHKYVKVQWTTKDWIFMSVLTVVYAVVALFYLGTTECPETSWTPNAVGETITIKLEEPTVIDRFYMFEGVRQRAYDDYTYKVSYVDSSGQLVTAETIHGDYATYCDWKHYSLGEITTDTIVVEVRALGAPINEICLTAPESRDAIAIQSVTYTSADKSTSYAVTEISDEQGTLDYSSTILTGMIFDEIYHARTAYEHLHGISQYETTHPPLGKLIISLGILIFGMNTFGWRIMGTLFGIAMVPLMYAFGKKVFKRTDLAFITALLMAVDFMHFSQTRIATIDTYVVFFIILMFYFMYDCFVYGAVEMGYKRYVAHLAVCGIMFGLGCAAKWIGIYAGLGLAFLFFIGKYKEVDSYSRSIKGFMNKYFWRIILLCCLFFVVIPLTIYMLSYIPVQAAEGHAKGLKAWWDSQTLMFNYHSGLEATHPFASDWWQWPLDVVPVLFYRGSDMLGDLSGSASTMGNPFIWWMTVPAIIFATVIAYYKKDRRMVPVLAAYWSQYLPWILVSRLVFIYHYFSCVPFAIIAIVYVMEYFIETYPKAKRYCYIYAAACGVLFVLFWPVLSGYPVERSYVTNVLKWFGSWPF